VAAAAQASVGGGAAEENNKIIPTFTTPTYSASGVRRPRGCIIKTRRHKLLLCARVHVPRGSPTYIYTHAHIHLPVWSRGSKQQCHQHARSGAFVEAAVQGQHEALSQQRVRGDTQCPRNAMQGEGGENTEGGNPPLAPVLDVCTRRNAAQWCVPADCCVRAADTPCCSARKRVRHCPGLFIIPPAYL
jgi:hypothetical protein